jgi:O-acetyl-ADP-ribose deacetylase (regulator of RNase III)
MVKTATGNIWRVPTDVIVIPTNGDVNRHGEAVMGRGLALQAARRYPLLPKVLAHLMRELGNHVLDAYRPRSLPIIVTFPVKHHWHHVAQLDLIERSAKELVALADHHEYRRVALPRVGCGNGQLDWKDVRPILERHLDDRFTVISLPSEVHHG